MSELMTTAEVAAYLRRPVATLHQWRHRGVGPPGMRVGRGTLYRRENVDIWLDELAVPANAKRLAISILEDALKVLRESLGPSVSHSDRFTMVKYVSEVVKTAKQLLTDETHFRLEMSADAEARRKQLSAKLNELSRRIRPTE